MSYPPPPEGHGNAGPYGYPPQQGPAPVPPPPPMPPPPPPGGQQGWQGAGGQGAQGAPYGGAMSAPQPPPPAQPRKNTGRTCLSAFLGIVGGLAMLGGGALTAHAYSNHGQNIANRTEYGASMWRNERADTLFPDTLASRKGTRSETTDRERAQWHRVGISQQTGCDDGLSGAVATEAKKLGCEAVLRATYVDPTGNTVATAALIVLPKSDSVKTEMSTFFDAEKEKDNPGPGVKAYGVPGTIAARWSDARANGSAGQSVTEMYLPYALMASAGAVDGRKAGELPGEWGRYSLDAEQDRAPWRGAADGLVDALNLHLMDLLTEGTS